jgi:hypothetical protein
LVQIEQYHPSYLSINSRRFKVRANSNTSFKKKFVDTYGLGSCCIMSISFSLTVLPSTSSSSSSAFCNLDRAVTAWIRTEYSLSRTRSNKDFFNF